MALTKCKECGGQLSTDAEACPGCGAKRPKRTSTLTWVIGGFFLFAIIAGITAKSKDTTPADAATASARQAEDAADTKRYQAATASADALKQAARDPDSLKFESIGVSVDAKVVCATYRARNGFGGMNRDAAIFVRDQGQTATTAAWKKNCGNLIDYLYAVK